MPRQRRSTSVLVGQPLGRVWADVDVFGSVGGVNRRPRSGGLYPRLWPLALPALVVVAGSMGFSLIEVGRMSLENVNFLSGQAGAYVGLKNYASLFETPEFSQALEKTVLFTGLSVIGQVASAVVLALLLWQDTQPARVASAVLAIPWAVPPIVVAIVWRFLYLPDVSPGAVVLSALGFQNGVLASPTWAIVALAVANIWEFTPLYFLFVSAHLRSLDPALVDAARIDGAGRLPLFGNIVLPHLRPLLVTLATFDVLASFGLFDLIWVMTQGGPFGSTQTMSLYSYTKGFHEYQFGNASAAVAVTMIVAVVLIVLLQVAFGRSKA